MKAAIQEGVVEVSEEETEVGMKPSCRPTMPKSRGKDMAIIIASQSTGTEGEEEKEEKDGDEEEDEEDKEAGEEGEEGAAPEEAAYEDKPSPVSSKKKKKKKSLISLDDSEDDGEESDVSEEYHATDD